MTTIKWELIYIIVKNILFIAFRRFLLGLLMLGVSSVCAANSGITLHNTHERMDLNSSPLASGFFVVPDNQSPAETLTTLQYDPYQYARILKPDFSRHSSYGLFIPVSNNTQSESWVIHISRFLVDRADVYIQTANKTTHHSYDFMQSAGMQEFENVMGRGIPITLPSNEQTYLYIKLTANSDVPRIYIGLMSDVKYAQWTSQVSSMFHLGLGIIVGLILIALLGYFILRDSTLLWFAISSSFLVAMTLLRSHYGIDIIQAEDSGVPSWHPVFLALTSASLLIFAAKFLSIEEESPWLIKAFKFALIFNLFAGIVSVLLSTEASIKLAGIMGLTTTVLAIYAGAIKTFKHGRYYILFMLGWIPILMLVVGNVHARFSPLELGQSTLSYFLLKDIVYKILHLFFHFSAIFVRVMELKKQKIIVETQSQAKTTFLASISHDLRHPLHTMKLLLSRLETQADSEEQKETIQQLTRVHASTNETFSGLMDWSQLDAGQVSICIEEIDIDNIFNDLRCEFFELAKQKNIKLRIRPTRLRVQTDPVLLKRMLRNLLGNAIKYTDSGGVLLAVKARQNGLAFEVWDTGCGISESEQASIFEIYQRSSTAQKAYAGTGIGLANVKLITQILGVQISVRSQVGKGSVFKLCFGIEPSQSAKTDLSNPQDAVSPTLQVKNCLTNSQLSQQVERYLAIWGYNSYEQSDTPSSNESPLIILTDDLSKLTGDTHNNCVCPIGLYQDAPLKDSDTFNYNNEIHWLGSHFTPARLRAFIRFAESNQSNSVKA